MTPSCRRDVVTHLQHAFCVSERCACRATGFSRATQRYRSQAAPQDELRLRLKELAQARVRYGLIFFGVGGVWLLLGLFAPK